MNGWLILNILLQTIRAVASLVLKAFSHQETKSTNLPGRQTWYFSLCSWWLSGKDNTNICAGNSIS